MLPEQRGMLSNLFSRFRLKQRGSVKLPSKSTGRVRRARIERMEERAMLTATMYVDFGNQLGTLTQSTGAWSTYGVNVPAGEASWIEGPLFPYNAGVAVTYQPFANIVPQQLINEFAPEVGPNFNDTPYRYVAGPLPPISVVSAMETSILEIIARQMAPYNITVVSSAATSMANVRALLAGNNRAVDPYKVEDHAALPMPPLMDPFYNLTTNRQMPGQVPPGFNPLQVDATGAPVGTRDVYIFIGGWTRGGNQVGLETGINFGFSNLTLGPSFAPVVVADPYDPVFTSIPISYADGGAAVNADTIAFQALNLAGSVAGNRTIQFNVACANVATQVGMLTYGLQYIDSNTLTLHSIEHSQDGLSSVGNPYFNTDTELLTGSDVLREGPQELLQGFPALNAVSFLSNLDLMVGDANQNPLLKQNAYDYFTQMTDWIGPSPLGVGYVTGTGAHDHISIVDNPVNPGVGQALVTIDSYRLPTMDASSLIQSVSYTLDLTTLSFLEIEGGNGNDQIDMDASISGLANLRIDVFGGDGVGEINNFSLTGDGTQDVSIVTSNFDVFQYTGLEKHLTAIQVAGAGLPIVFNLNEFQDTSLLHLENFNSLDYQMPQFLGDDFSINSRAGSGLVKPPSASLVDMVIDGTAGPTLLSPTPIEVANVEFTKINTFSISSPIGNTSDQVTVQSSLGFADGLQNFSVKLGPGTDSLILTGTNFSLPVAGGAFTFDGGAGIDTINARGNTNWTLIDGDAGLMTDGMLICGGGGQIILKNMIGDIANLVGGSGNNTIEVDSWSGTAILNGFAGNNTFILGTALTPVTGTVTLAGGTGNDTINFVNFTGTGTLNGGNGNDTFNVKKLSGFGVVLRGGSGNDTFNIGGSGGGSATVTGAPDISGDDGADTLVVDDSTLASVVNYFIDSASVSSTLAGFNGVSYDDTVENVTVNGTQAANVFNVAPSLKATIRVNGGAPLPGSPGAQNELDIDFFGTKGAKLTGGLAPPGPGNGAWTFTSGQKPVIFTSIGGALQEVSAAATPFLAVGSAKGKGSKPLVKVFDASSNDLLYSFYAYETSFAGGVRVTLADMNSDGVADVIVAPGAGRAAQVKVYDGAQLLAAAPTSSQHLVASPNSALIGAGFYPEGTSYKSGLYVAAGDVDGDGNVDVVTSSTTGLGKIRVFTQSGSSWAQRRSFTPYTSSEKVTTGAVVAVADVDGDGRPDIITAPGPGTAVIVKVFDGLTKANLRKFNGFESSFKNGVSIAAADLDGDGLAEIMLGAGANGKSRVRVLNGFGTLQKEFKAFTSGNINAPLNIAAHIVDGQIELFVAQSNDGRSREIRHFDPLTGTLVDSFLENDSTFAAGVNLG